MSLKNLFNYIYKKKTNEFFLLIILFFYISIIFIKSQGTDNTNSWIEWIEYANKFGIIEGYKYKVTTYPPFSTLILKSFYNLLFFFNSNITIFYAVKFTIFFFLFLSTFIIYFYTSNFQITIFYFLTFLISSVGLNDLDILFGTFLILSFIFLKKNNLFFFTLFYGCSVLTKWQPIIIAPIILVYISKYNITNKLNFINVKKYFFNIRSCIIPFFFLCIFFFGTYGFLPIIKSLYVSIDHNYVSGNALNYNWIVTWLLKTYDTINYSPIIDGRMNWTKIRSKNILIYTGQILFILTYIYLLLTFLFLKKKNLADLLLFCAIVSFSYFILNKGVHQNHLFMSALLFILAYTENKKFFTYMIITSIIFNMNLFIFYGPTGTEVIDRVISKSFDLTIFTSILNIFFLINLILCLKTKYKKN
jgi:hypothetical protein